MAKVFLSHSSENKDLVEKIGTRLGKDSCHLDSLTFEAGNKTIEEIFAGLESTDIFVLFISEPALKSYWVQEEIVKAKQLLDRNIIERIFPIIIDKTISFSDSRIPDWLRKPYNIKYFDNEVLIFQKIKQLIRESEFNKFSHLKELKELFVGRYKLLEDFDRRIFNIENVKPSCLIAYNFIEGMGRRTFMKTALVRTGIRDKWYEPILIPFSTRESIEDFIYKLNFIEKAKEIFSYNLSEEQLSSKIKIARDVVVKFLRNNEIIFIVDEGGIILPNKQIVPWFIELLNDECFHNQISICIISKFKPNPILLRKLNNIISFQVDELTQSEIQILFVQYLDKMQIKITQEDAIFFIKHLHGIPSQVVYAANLISTIGIQESKMYLENIDEFDELSAITVMDFFKDEPLCKQILIALSRFEIISYDLVYRIFGDNDIVYSAIQKIFDIGLLYNISSTHEYLKLNSSVSDYINRSQLNLDSEYNLNLRNIVKESISKPIELNEYSDYSEFLMSIENMIRSDQKIPSKFFLPSFILKSIVKEYYNRKYTIVIELALKIIDGAQKFDSQIIREIIYWLCLAYCRTGDESFFKTVQYYKDGDLYDMKDYNFLIGFFYRIADKMDIAEDYFKRVLAIDSEHSKTKRELVNVYLRKREFGKALQLAEDNYYKFKNNILHINAYFTCLIKKPNLSTTDYDVLEELLEKTKKSIDKRSEEFFNTMSSEYQYYINANTGKAVSSLREALRVNRSDYHSFKALSEIYRRENLNDDLDDLNRQYPHLAKDED